MSPELDLIKNLYADPDDFYGHLVHIALLTVNIAWWHYEIIK
jgi:hypothetical protein